jgi:hypothetical protein
MPAVRIRGLLLRASLVATIAALGLAVGLGAFGQGAGASIANCAPRRIVGVTDNRTGVPAKLLAESYTHGNFWCRAPHDDVLAHKGNQWILGAESGAMSMYLRYRLKNGDEILFRAQLRSPSGIETGCSFVHVVKTPREYECSAEVSGGASHVAFVKFLILLGK